MSEKNDSQCNKSQRDTLAEEMTSKEVNRLLPVELLTKWSDLLGCVMVGEDMEYGCVFYV